MPKHPLTKAALNRALAEIHPDPEIARELLAMGIFRLRTRGGHALHDRCGAWARSAGRPCIAKAIRAGRCRHHGAGSTGPKSPQGCSLPQGLGSLLEALESGARQAPQEASASVLLRLVGRELLKIDEQGQ